MNTSACPWAPLVITAAAIGAPLSAQQADPVGSWSGTLVAGPQEIQIVFHVQRSDEGALAGTMDVPTQGAVGIPLTTVVFEGDILEMTFPVPGGGRYEGTLRGDAVSGTFTQAGQPLPLDLERGTGDSTFVRPQHPEPPFPYRVEEVRFPNAEAGVELAGTLTLPEGPGPFPTAVLVSGSGPQDRDESLAGHKPFLVLADHLTRRGIAVLRYDDRGVAGSTGDFDASTTEDFADDALAAVDFVASDSRIDAASVGIVGHSEGGLVGPMAASRSETVKYVVMLAGPGVTGIEVLVEQGKLINDASGADPGMTAFNARLQEVLADVVRAEPETTAAAVEMRAALRREIQSLSPETRAVIEAQMTDDVIEELVGEMNAPWFRFFIDHDPRDALERTAVPVLALFGSKDLQVPPAQSASEVEGALVRGGNDDVTVRVLSNLNHLFQEADTGSPSEYPTIEQTMSPTALEAVSDWISERFAADARDRRRP